MNPAKLENYLTTIICRNKINPRWDDFAASISGCNIEQTSVWGSLICKDGIWNEHVRIILLKENIIIGGAQILIRNYIKGWKIGFIHQGPCFNYHNWYETEKLINTIKTFTKSEKLLYVTCDVAYNLPLLPGLLKKHQFTKAFERLPPIPIIESTNLLDLTQDLDSLMQSFSAGRRNSIRGGLKHPIKIRTGGRDDIEVFFELMLKACDRRNIDPLFSDIEYFYNLWDFLSPKKWIVLHIATINKKPICATIGFAFGDTFRNSLWGASDEMTQLNASSIIDWKTICWAKEHGFSHYDFVQLDTESAIAIESKLPLDEKVKNRQNFGSTFYKLSFGGRILYYPGNYTYFSSSVIKYILKFLLKMTSSTGIGLKIYRLIRRNSFTKS
jgi:lipid II:glycine glycyltransferase (peptidoglycan interpeptide bridge formation enzyme)